MLLTCAAASSTGASSKQPATSNPCVHIRKSYSRGSSCRHNLLQLLLAALVCCACVADACSNHGLDAAAAKCSAPALTAAAAAAGLSSHRQTSAAPPPTRAAAPVSIPAAADADEEPISIVYEEVSEADLIAATHRRKLLAKKKARKAAKADAAAAEGGEDHTDHQHAGHSHRPGRRCGARDVSAAERSEVSLHMQQYRARQAVLQRARLSSMATAAAMPAQRTSLNIPLYFHVITGKKPNSTVDAPQELLLKQLQAMNDAYGRYSIRFDLKGITRVQSESWAIAEINSAEENLLKAKLRKGSLGDLNIYVIRPASGTLGWSTFPWEAIKLGESFDGVLIHVGTMPGGNMRPYNKGYTLVHEVGHWLGLLHVFENGCDSPGDSVEDTPPQASAAYGCPLTRHTCPGSPTTDPVTNYMGYTDDACMTAFTRGQADRVLAMWDIYRAAPAQQQQQQQQNALLGNKVPPAASNSQQQQQQQQFASKEQLPPRPQQQQQQGGATLLEQGADAVWGQGLPQQQQQQPAEHIPESVQFIAAPPPVDPAAAFASKQAAAGAQPGQLPAAPQQKPGAAIKAQWGPPAPAPAAAPAPRPRWNGWLLGPGSSLLQPTPHGPAFEAPGGLKQQQEEEAQPKHRPRHKPHRASWGSWLTGRPAASAAGAPQPPTTTLALQAPAPGVLASYQQLNPEMGQYAALQALRPDVSATSPRDAPLRPWSQELSTQQQQLLQQQLQYQYAQQLPSYQHAAEEAMLPPGYSGPLGPQYFLGAAPGNSAANNQAALLAAMGGVYGAAPASGYEGYFDAAAAAGSGAGELLAPVVAPPPPPHEKHGRRGGRKKAKANRG